MAPTVLWGRETRHVPTDVGTWVTPAWLALDLLLVDLYREYQSTLCPGCGEPMESHEGRTWRDYGSASVECPALVALEKAQAARAKADGHKDAKPDPSRARRWIFGTHQMVRGYVDWVKSLASRGADG